MTSALIVLLIVLSVALLLAGVALLLAVFINAGLIRRLAAESTWKACWLAEPARQPRPEAPRQPVPRKPAKAATALRPEAPRQPVPRKPAKAATALPGKEGSGSLAAAVSTIPEYYGGDVPAGAGCNRGDSSMDAFGSAGGMIGVDRGDVCVTWCRPRWPPSRTAGGYEECMCGRGPRPVWDCG